MTDKKKDQIPWYKAIRQELDERDASCKNHFGPNNEYLRPNVNPYKYPDVASFKRAFPFTRNTNNCKLINQYVESTTDPANRYYENPRHESQCKNLKGVWRKDVNRKNKYDIGTCWTNQDDAYCGTNYQVPPLLRPQDVKSQNLEELAKKAGEICDADEKCKWMKTGKYSYDCFSKKSSTKAEAANSFEPPKNMPKDVTKGNIEKYLFDWYVTKQPSPPPETNELFGKGNRCSATSQQEFEVEAVSKDPDVRRFERKKATIRSIDPLKPGSHTALLSYINEFEIRRYKREYQELQKKNDLSDVQKEKLYQKYFAKYFTSPMVDHILSLQDQEDAKEVKSKLLPSVPQSVVNMIMKHVASLGRETTNRGMLAWHSTGSGKTCTAAGVIDAFWDDTDRDIIFVSSLDAIASNPDYKFHECALNLYPRFQSDAFKGETSEETLGNVGAAFAKRGVRFLSFAKLSNRVRKTREYMRGGAAKKKQDKSSRSRSRSPSPKKKSDTKTKSRARSESPSASPKKTRKSKADTKTKSRSRSESPSASPKKKSKQSKKSRKSASPPPRRSKSRSRSRTPEKRRRRRDASASPSPRSHSPSLGKDEFVDLNKSILIIDEVHNLFRPLATQRQQHEYLEKQLLDPKRFPKLKIVILTATPGDNIPDVIKLLNIVRDPSHSSIVAPNIEDANDVRGFKNDIRGLISFFDMSSDLTKFPQVIDHEPIKYPMSMTQFNRYVEAYNEVKSDARDFKKLAKRNQANKYWAAPRRYANTLFNFDKDMALSDFSSKMPALLENIQKAPSAKHYVYSAFFENRGYGGHGILAIANELDKLGYSKLTVKEAKKYNALNDTPPKKLRYVLAISNEIGDEGSSSAGKNLHELIKIYNSSANKDGEYIHVFLASQGFNEGIDLKGVRNIHFFEPLVTWASDKQTLGRAARYCSHADLDRDKGEWAVNIHRYMSDFPIEVTTKTFVQNEDKEKELRQQLNQLETTVAKLDKKTQREDFIRGKILIDEVKDELKALDKEIKSRKKINLDTLKNIEEVVFNESRQRMKELLVVYQAMKEAAVDCRILQKFHSATGNQVKCEPFES